MKMIRIRQHINTYPQFRFINLREVESIDTSETKGILTLKIQLFSGETLLLVNSKESGLRFTLQWERFKTTEDMYLDLVEFTLK